MSAGLETADAARVPDALTLDMVAAAWNRCTGDALRARNVVPIRPKRWWEWGHHLYVFKIERNDSSYEKPAVAMLCSSERVAFERRVYEDLLSQTAISRPEYFGSFPADTPGLAWQFLEFVEYRSFRRADPSHAVAMASWLGSLHAALREWASSAVLPSRGLDFHLSQLATAKHKLVSARNRGEYLRSAERERAENIVALLEDVDRCLLDNGGAVRESPRGFVHADLKSDNIGFVAGREPRLLPYDWEFAGWGPLAVDVGTTLVHRDVIFPYLRALRAAWPDISASDVEHMGCIGELLRAVMAIRWLSDGIPLTPADKVLRGIEAQLDIIEARREELSW